VFGQEIDGGLHHGDARRSDGFPVVLALARPAIAAAAAAAPSSARRSIFDGMKPP
jgi:hypothetical protein